MYLIIYFHTYFYCESFYNHFKGLIALDSEGEKALLYLNSSQNLWVLLKQKIIVFMTYALFTTLITQFVLYFLSGFNFYLLIWLLVGQTTSLLLFILFLVLPSVYNAHFNFFNIEQVGDFADQKTTSSIINLTITGGLIPLLMIPCIVYLFDSIDLIELAYINMSIIFIELIAVVFLIYMFKRKVSSNNYFWGRY